MTVAEVAARAGAVRAAMTGPLSLQLSLLGPRAASLPAFSGDCFSAQ